MKISRAMDIGALVKAVLTPITLDDHCGLRENAIGALLNEEFDMEQYNERGQFRACFMVMIHDCNAAFGRMDYNHTHWAYDTSRV